MHRGAHESTTKRIGKTQQKEHEDHIAGRGIQFVESLQSVHMFIPVLHAMKIPDAKAAVDKELGKLEQLPAWHMTKVSCEK